MKKNNQTRCGWAEGDLLMQAYHDKEWGVPLHNDQKLFEFLILEGAQAGLSWRTVLYRREGYRRAFHQFDAKKMAAMGAKDILRLMKNPGIIRNRLKIISAIENAKACLRIKEEFGSLDRYLWSFVGKRKITHRLPTYRHLPTTIPESEAMSKDLKSRGFNFVGSTICYAFMQATGMVDDHQAGCSWGKR